MRGLLVFCFVAVASAYPQGNQYLPPGGQSHGTHTLAIPTHGGSHSHSHPSPVAPELITKNIYIHSAAEDNDEDAGDDALSSLSGKTNYNILFIKAPAQSSASLAASLAKLQQNDKTVVYVLNKKTDASELQNALDQVKSQPTKPEVFFIKYKTPQEAAHAQETIKAQYDSLGGTTNVSDEGESPVSSVIGSVGPSRGAGSNVGGASNAYLPPSY